METSDTLVLVSAPSVYPCRLSRLLRQEVLAYGSHEAFVLVLGIKYL